MEEAKVSEKRARRGATAAITISRQEINDWVRKGRSAHKISRRQIAFIKQARARRAAAPGTQPVQQPRRPARGRPRARPRRPGGGIMRRK